MNRYKNRRFADRQRDRPSPTRTHFGRNSVSRHRTADLNSVESRNRGVITLCEVAPALKEIHARMRARELYSDDLPAAYLRLLYGLTDDTPIDSRVDQLVKMNETERSDGATFSEAGRNS